MCVNNAVLQPAVGTNLYNTDCTTTISAQMNLIVTKAESQTQDSVTNSILPVPEADPCEFSTHAPPSTIEKLVP